MKRIFQNLFVLLSITIATSSYSQEDTSGKKKWKAVPVKTISVEAEVIGVLEESNVLAVLKITKVDTANEIALKAGEEVLVQFQFTTDPVKNEPQMAGISGGETIVAKLAGKYNRNTKQYDYRVFEYRVTSKFIEVEATPVKKNEK